MGMTWYTFRCLGCEADREEVFTHRTAPSVGEVVQLEPCPECGERRAKRRPGGGAFVLRGGGWGRG